MVSLSIDMFGEEIGRHEPNKTEIGQPLARRRALHWIRAYTIDSLIYYHKGYGNKTGQIQDLIGEDTHALEIVRSMEILQGHQDAYQEKNNPEIGRNVYMQYMWIFLRHIETFKAFF